MSQAELVDDAAAAKLAPFSETVAFGGGTEGQAAAGEVTVGVARAVGSKCARCWNYSESVGAGADLCERCSPVVARLGFKLPVAKPEAVAAA